MQKYISSPQSLIHWHSFGFIPDSKKIDNAL
jgi:hypothetical protein